MPFTVHLSLKGVSLRNLSKPKLVQAQQLYSPSIKCALNDFTQRKTKNLLLNFADFLIKYETLKSLITGEIVQEHFNYEAPEFPCSPMVISSKMHRTHNAQGMKWINKKCVAITDMFEMVLKH